MTKETTQHSQGDQGDQGNQDNGHLSPFIVGMVLLLIVGALVVATTLALNFFMHFLSIPALIVGIVLIAVAVSFLVFKA